MLRHSLSGSIVLLLLLQAPSYLQAQELVFCESVRQDGTRIGAARNFFIEKKGSAVDFFVRAPGIFNCSRVTIDLYRLTSDGKEKFDRSIGIDVRPYDRWVHQKVIFNEPAAFAAYAYDESGRLLGAGELNLLFRK